MRSALKELRIEAGLSQAALAGILMVSRQTINAIETSRYDPSLTLAVRIARHFNRPVEEIFYVED
ncbi:transcriptional regulator [Cryobacterium algoricola]|uniref:Helix-turn-helix transcriptional regulator n=2 Tax=Cryobacterium TaxID=69578 RepID=A0AA41QWR9_9MICO|nr:MULTISPECIES: helix-turn-helix transcriptional regulator [Cryobacterium]MCI4658033.1 helix-turn-helix transcriptional regulator [Cryobacterium zhongshanensis]TFB86194.1 transcriptional regulator [Cryobacterium algoricola]